MNLEDEDQNLNTKKLPYCNTSGQSTIKKKIVFGFFLESKGLQGCEDKKAKCCQKVVILLKIVASILQSLTATLNLYFLITHNPEFVKQALDFLKHLVSAR